MRRRHIGLIAGAALAGLLATPAAAADEAISYYLTRTEVSVALKLTLEGCPGGNDTLPRIASSWVVKASGAADGGPSAVRVDVSKGWLAKRSTAFAFNPNGTLAAFNAQAEGQAGAVLESVFKMVGTVAGIALPVRGPASVDDDGPAVAQPKPEMVACTAEVVARLDSLGALDTKIGELEAIILNGEPLAAQIALLEQLRTARAQTVKSLTITVPAVFTGDGQASPWSAAVGEPPIRGKWFAPATSAHPGRFDINQIAGVEGYDVAIIAKGPVESYTIDQWIDAKTGRLVKATVVTTNATGKITLELTSKK